MLKDNNFYPLFKSLTIY